MQRGREREREEKASCVANGVPKGEFSKRKHRMAAQTKKEKKNRESSFARRRFYFELMA